MGKQSILRVPSVRSNHDGQNIEERGGEIKCIVCGYRVLKKTKPPVVKKVPAT